MDTEAQIQNKNKNHRSMNPIVRQRGEKFNICSTHVTTQVQVHPNGSPKNKQKKPPTE